MCKQKILGLDLGSNSIGWAILEGHKGRPQGIIDCGCRIFNKSVKEKTPTPKNVKRREKRLARRVLQRRARRKKRMLNYLIKLGLLPEILKDNPQPEIILNKLGNPYQLRAKALDEKLSVYELGRIFLHLVQRRGFLSSKKTLLGDMVDDPDVQAILSETDNDNNTSSDRVKEEKDFKIDISELRKAIAKKKCRTLGEYLSKLPDHNCQRNRSHDSRHLRTDRQMYREELDLIWQKQSEFNDILDPTVKKQIEHIIFFQRPLKLQAGRQGNCSLEHSKKRARMGRLEYQKFRYLQDINNLQYREPNEIRLVSIQETDREKLIELFDKNPTVTFPKIKKALNLHRKTEFNLETNAKNLKGNTTASKIRKVFADWDSWTKKKQYALMEDMITINKKSVLKNRLISHWNINTQTAIQLCMIEFEPGHANLSLKAIKSLLPYMEQGQIYSKARVSAGYGYDEQKVNAVDRLGTPPNISNPIVSKGLHELRRVVNAVIAEHGKPDVIRIELARDFEMNTKRYKQYIKQQKKNKKANEEAVQIYNDIQEKNPRLKLSAYPQKDVGLRYRLWKDQDERCAYSNRTISATTLFSPEIEIDHIIPYSQSWDDSYMNKVVCFAFENRQKGKRTPIDAFGGSVEKWEQITKAIGKWGKKLRPKKNNFYMTEDQVQERDFLSNQLNDTRYISKEALTYLEQLGSDVTATKGFLVDRVRRQWGLNALIGETDEKDRTDHRHHTIDAVVIACIDRKFHRRLVGAAKYAEKKGPIDPPWTTIREDTQAAIANIIVSHSPLRKLSGALHEETGVGFIEGIGTVTRVALNGNFKFTQGDKIIDKQVKTIVKKHLAQHDNKPKRAFADNVTVYHRDDKTPIRRVRIIQSKTTANKLRQNKLAVKNNQGNVFKWMAYGNMHHVEIIKNKQTGEVSGVFVTMMEAHRRALTGSDSAKKKGVIKEPIVQQDHGENFLFLMGIHKNDTVSIENKGVSKFYRVQKLDRANKRIKLRLNTAATIKNPSETLIDRESTIPALVAKNLILHRVNVLGKFIDDKTYH